MNLVHSLRTLVASISTGCGGGGGGGGGGMEAGGGAGTEVGTDFEDDGLDGSGGAALVAGKADLAWAPRRFGGMEKAGLDGGGRAREIYDATELSRTRMEQEMRR